MTSSGNTDLWLVFPHQLFGSFPSGTGEVAILEEGLFFTEFAFHKQKLTYHRASMRCYADQLQKQGYRVRYLACDGKALDLSVWVKRWSDEGFRSLHLYRLEDDWLVQRLSAAAVSNDIALIYHDTPQFLLNRADVKSYFAGKKHFLQANFYSAQRKQFQVLMDGAKPRGGKWSFDEDNRQRFPKDGVVPVLRQVRSDRELAYWHEAVDYIQAYFPQAPGDVEGDFQYAISHEGAQQWLTEFIDHRLHHFGTYEDALVAKEPLLHHSLLSVYLNNGLLLPKDVLDAVLQAYERRGLPLNDIEGFVRQLLGWREFIRGLYLSVGRKQRTRNYWGYTRKIPRSFYDGTTGIVPVDVVIKKVLKNGYCHHIERLMVLSNFMLLCDFDPDEVYRWFMELFMDAYDWVMVPNVYGMGQFADGGMMSTKPYISGSNYLMKMGDFEKGPWTEVWDGLYWRFIDKHRDFFLKNPRMGVMVKSYDKMDVGKRDRLSAVANQFLEGLSDE
ncbi:MAG: cryptochrome/photolyase family protein [Bacteroidia bacterium]